MKHVDFTLSLEQVRLTKAEANLKHYKVQAVASKLPANACMARMNQKHTRDQSLSYI